MNNTKTALCVWCICITLSMLMVNASPEARAQSAPTVFVPESQPTSSASTIIDFDHFETGPVPKDFTPFLIGGGKDVLWEIRPEPSAISGPKVLAQTSYDQVDYRFPLLLYNNVTAKNVRVTVQFKQVSGKIDQAAGVIVRFQNPEHFYVARANALEGTVQLYRVVNGRRQIITGVNTRVVSDQWHSLEVDAQDDNLTVYFDAQQLFTARDTTLAQAGKVGLSTKSDGVTIFDDLRITVLD